MYLSVSEEAVNAILVQVVEKEERLVYFVSRTLRATETRSQMIEKVTFSLILTAMQMRSYF